MLIMLAVASPCFTLPEFLVPGDWFSHLRHPHRQPKVGNRRRHVEFPDNATWFKIIQTASKAIRSNISNTGMVFVETVPIVHEIMLHQPSFCRSHCRRRQRGRGWGWPTFHAVCTNHSHECHKQHVGYFDIERFFP